ncbi:hypothetical protein ACQI4F_09185 [Mycolicibacterium vaccae]|uniref:hypothetical protein n=1 Tax=Mycolicibacterium vaccae TaxID=1810 RepID=UPI003CF08742
MTRPRSLGALVAVPLAVVLSTGIAHAQPFAQLDPVAVHPSPTCGGTVRAEAQVAPLQVGLQVENGVRVAVNYDAGVYDGSCSLTVQAHWRNLDTGASGSGDITAVSRIDGHYGFIGYANTTFYTGPGTVVVTLSSHPGAELTVTP